MSRGNMSLPAQMTISGLCYLTLVVFFLAHAPAHARVFNYKDAKVGTYIRGTGGLSAVDQDAFANSSGTGTSIDEKVNYNYSGELGFVYGIMEMVYLQLGAEIVRAHPINNALGTNSSGQELFSLNSSVFAFTPNVSIEVVYYQGEVFRLNARLSGGYSLFQVKNEYTVTPQGTTELGVDSFNEKLYGSGTSFQGSLGFETILFDNVTFLIDLGYRHMPIKTLRHHGSGSSIAQTSYAEGDQALNHGGDKRTIDLSGLFAGAAFRVYFNF